jgi:hypothetical protein
MGFYDIPGDPVRGELVTADATTAAVITLYNNDGTVRALAATERLAVTDIRITTGVAATVDLFFDTNANGAVDAGERISSGIFAANGGSIQSLETPVVGPKGIAAKGKSSLAGATTILISGVVMRA